MSTTPLQFDDKIEQLLKELGKTKDDIYKVSTVEATGEPGWCFENSFKFLKEHPDGFTPVFGWMIWQNLNVTEAEYHCLVESADGTLREVTKTRDGEKEIWFVRDQKENPAQELNKVIEGIAKNTFKRVLNVVIADEEYKRNYADGMKVLESLTAGFGKPYQSLRVEKKVGRNDPCPCGSGKKYKICHGSTVKQS